MKSTLRLLAILLILDILGGVAFWFGYTSMQVKKNEEIELRKQLVEENDKGKKLTALQRSLSSVAKEHAELSAFLYDPSEEGQLAFVSEIESLGTSTSRALVETASFAIGADEPAGFRGSFSMKGTWGEIFHFIRLLEEYPSNLIITRFDVRNAQTDKKWMGSVSINLNSIKPTK